MMAYIEYLNMPVKVAIVVVTAFLVMQLIGEILEFKGKVVPEFVKIRKIFARKKQECELFNKMTDTIEQVQVTLNDLNQHYSTDNITMRDKWIEKVNDKFDQYDKTMEELSKKIDKNNRDTLAILIENNRSAIIGFASLVTDETKPVTREQFNRIFKLYKSYEEIIQENELSNGEVDIAIRIIREAYEKHIRDHSFVEDVRGYSITTTV